MLDDPSDFSPREGIRYVELPSKVLDIENCDGRLMVTLGSGQVVDMTDWFSKDARQN